ncbi:MAG: hypothetical protein HDS37_04705 [Bacteroides sp.]|nr:hypothetical protein [Bacteroides sp.]
MAYVFRIHRQNGGGAPNPATFQNGWDKSVYLEGTLLDEIEAGQNVGRMGTSIPSIFARPMLFQTAFNTIIPLTYDDPGLNQQLISETFDMLEFLYQNAGSKKLSSQEWVAADQILRLKTSGNDALVRLGETLESHLQKIGNPASITMFFWEDTDTNGVTVKALIGGTSMSTLVFTSPNWSRIARENGWIFRRLDGTNFFGNELQSLNQRNSGFRDMIYNMRMTFDTEFQAQCGGNKGLAKYIWESIGDRHIAPMSISNFLAQYPAIKNVYAGNLPISRKDVDPVRSGYRIRPTSSRYANQISAAGGAMRIPVPMALNDKGLPGVEYVGGATWKPTYKIDEAKVRTTQYFNRELPGDMGVDYPYLTAFDLLEDKIVKVPGNIDVKNFYTLFDGESKYLLPLKRLFFDFFNIEDLDKADDRSQKKLVDITTDKEGTITVTVNMPIEDAAHNFIPLTKKYESSSIISPAKHIEIGFFPFYKVTDKPQLDVYSVMLAGSTNDTLDFYYLDTNQTKRIPATAMSRTAETNIMQNTKYFDVRGTIDLVEVCLDGGVKALVIPRMRKIITGATDYQFAVDFGTSNTYIAYRTPGGEIHTLTTGNQIDSQGQDVTDTQAIFLYNTEIVATLIDTIQREFMVPTIGMADSLTDFPIKTAVCEVSQFENQPQMNLFGNINVGFKFKHEISAGKVPNATYFTNLKWALEQNPGGKLPGWRVLAYCKEILWLLKNKALLNGGNENFKVMLTFPESMIDRSVFLDQVTGSGVWAEAEHELGLPATGRFADDVTESEAPYYKVVRGADNMLNIDIGGGTTDMFLVCHLDKNGDKLDNVSARYVSLKFAADDLWGDGATARMNTVGQNGFCQYLSEKIKANGEDISGITQLVKKSSDVMAALFSNDSRFKTSVLIRQNQNLKSILLIHYTSILFAAGRLLNKFDVGIPKILSFTGMGSKYLSLISTDPKRLTTFTADVLKLITGCEIPFGFTVDMHYKDAKEVTAKGALSKADVEVAFHIPDAYKESYVDLGCESYTNLTYGKLLRGAEVNAIRDDARKVFNAFIKLLKSDAYSQAAAKEFQLSIPPSMINDLDKLANSSFNNVQGAIPAAHSQRAVTDNLFFWFLKDSLCNLSTTYYNKNTN